MNTIRIKGMSCQHCVASVTKALEGLPGVSDVKVDLEKGKATYQGDINHGLVKEAIEKTGFDVVD
ncbi:heavy-metal-associated domain-containing protein [Desulfofustis glycolicus]|uniref:Heavy-metal-associated domain-containing protein n=1 Tax=Desulfofustis glycolicus DSM 9705 TaxID=1121409 RepID=A0A1M5X837_9BACT|nr:heavy metal-associated domain-containing protein [Desulfofustis glycolicus]SHH95995.1 Heavy-metal-associated domain-containing protein [Desulfofustis glycolicus DSM 9705]